MSHKLHNCSITDAADDVIKQKNKFYIVQLHRADEDDDSANRSYEIIHQSTVLNKLKSTLKVSAKTMSKMRCAGASCQLSSHNVLERSTCNQAPKNALGSYFDCY